ATLKPLTQRADLRGDDGAGSFDLVGDRSRVVRQIPAVRSSFDDSLRVLLDLQRPLADDLLRVGDGVLHGFLEVVCQLVEAAFRGAHYPLTSTMGKRRAVAKLLCAGPRSRNVLPTSEESSTQAVTVTRSSGATDAVVVVTGRCNTSWPTYTAA